MWLYVGGAVLLIAAVWLWCFKISVTPERVFWSTIERGLVSRGVTVEGTQTSGNATAKQIIRYSLGADNVSHSMTVLNQAGTKVVNEMLGTPTVDYTRYVDIKTNQKKRDGTPMDFSQILGVWAKGQNNAGQFFSQALFGSSLPVGGVAVPIANLPKHARAELMRQIRNDIVYQVNFAKVKKERKDGRLLYSYDVDIQPVAYVALVKRLAQLVGLHNLDEVDPASYRGQKAFKLKVTVDAHARHVVAIASRDGDQRQTYSGYDVPVQVSMPEDAISGAELQKRLSNLQ